MSQSNSGISISYKDAGVDINAGNALVERIKTVAKSTHRHGVLSGLGGFGALFELPEGYRKPVLVSGTDGVGTKLKLAIQTGRHDAIGIDLVAMCVNDLIVAGAEPLFFLDYYAAGKLDVDVAAAVVTGIGEGCNLAGAALVGGETAEMPGMYADSDYDLAGFCVGIVEKDNIIDGSKVTAGDAIIALPSSGPHANGYSLIRKIIDVTNADLTQPINDGTLIDALMTPTRIYVKPLLALCKQLSVHALSHITGGGLLENLPRVMPHYTHAVIDSNSWQHPDVFNWLKIQGGVTDDEMYRTFNCGIGMAIVVAEKNVSQAMRILQNEGEQPWLLGHIDTAKTPAPDVVIA